MICKPTPPMTLLDLEIKRFQRFAAECRRMVDIAGGYPLGGDDVSQRIGGEWAALALAFERVEEELKSGLTHAHKIESHAAAAAAATALRRLN